ncbi:MAG TPA: transglutaminase family protein, partial [Planctomycetaceae bacterium]|nr:transglutaminase family protein [Planctomycetaceae bacterium]
ADRLQQLPATLDPGVIELAEELFRDCVTPLDKVQAVRRYFVPYRHQLGIQVPRAWRSDPLAYFLLERPAAHCEFFASGAAVLLRLGGIPCRYVTGFAGGDYNPIGRYWIVRQHEAHAWVEAYLPGDGWVVVDTTPSAGVPAASESFSLWHFWDEINLRGQMIRAALATGTVQGTLLAVKLFLLTLLTTIPGWLLTSGMLFLLARQFQFRHHVRRATALTPALIELQRLLRELDRRLGRLRLERAAHETLHQFAERLRLEATARPILASAADWYLSYAAARYGTDPREPIRESLRLELQQVCARLTKSNRSPLSPTLEMTANDDGRRTQ